MAYIVSFQYDDENREERVDSDRFEITDSGALVFLRIGEYGDYPERAFNAGVWFSVRIAKE